MPSWNRPYYGLRQNGTSKGPGWLGNVGTEENHITEFSFGVDLGNGEEDIPSLVPTLMPRDIDNVRSGNITPEIAQKAVEFAIMRKKLGLSPFKEISDLETGE